MIESGDDVFDASYMDRELMMEEDQGVVQGKTSVYKSNNNKIQQQEEVGKRRSPFPGFAAAMAIWSFFRPLPAFAQGAAPALATRGSGLSLLARGVTAVAAVALTYLVKRVFAGKPAEPPHRIYGRWRTDIPREEGYSHELISEASRPLLAAGKTDLETLKAEPFPGVDTVFKAMRRNLQLIPNRDVLGTKVDGVYQWQTWKEAMQEAEDLSIGFKTLDMVPELEAEGRTWRFFGIQSKNRREWVLACMAGMFQGMTAVALYDTLGENALNFICGQTELRTIVVEDTLVKSLCEMKAGAPKELSALQNLVVMGEKTADMLELADAAGLKLYTFQEVVDEGAKHRLANGPMPQIEPTPEDVYMLSYTSGTTGVPKGVKLTQKMILNSAQGVEQRVQGAPGGGAGPDDAYLSYLPLAHSFEQSLFATVLTYGVKCGFYSGNLLALTSDLEALQPTMFASVPSFWNRIYGKIQKKFTDATGVKKLLIDQAVATKLKNLKEGKGDTHALYDRLVFNKTKQILGGRTRALISGSAPISGDVLHFLQACFQCIITNGYGMTEGCGAQTAGEVGDAYVGHVGGPLQHTKIRLRDLPELGYLSTDSPARGEICFKGAPVSSGYFRNPEKTAEQFVDGWLLSGDVGSIDEYGTITIIDRVKNLFKLANGEYVAPEKIESVFVQSDWVLQCWLYGDSMKDYPVAFVVVDPDQLTEYAKENGLKADSDEILEDPKLKQLVFNSLGKLAESNNLVRQEYPKQIQLLRDMWTPKSGLLTPTMKMKRNVMRDQFSEHIDQLYSSRVMVVQRDKEAVPA